MVDFETIIPELAVSRNVYPEHAIQLAYELDELPNNVWRNHASSTGMHYIACSIMQGELNSGGRLSQKALYALGLIVKLTEFDDKENIIINRQSRGAKQVIHADGNQKPPVYVFHLSDEGQFDFFPSGNIEDEPEKLLTNRGDIVRIMSNTLLHRGVNPSLNVRYTVVFDNWA